MWQSKGLHELAQCTSNTGYTEANDSLCKVRGMETERSVRRRAAKTVAA